MLKDAGEVSLDLCKRVLAATHNEGLTPTVYSNVYDLKKRIVYLYYFHDFQNVVKIDLAGELKKGARRMDLPALFPRIFSAEVFRNKMVNELDAQKAKYTHKVKTEILESYVGRYRVAADEGEPMVVIITRQGDKIFAGTKYQAKQQLYPVSDTEFMYVTSDVDVKMSFIIDDKGEAAKLKAEAGGNGYTAERIE